MKPTFLCIGVQKGGTTSLINYLNIHPEIYMRTGEPCFFQNIDLTVNNIKEYEKYFATNKPILGEKSPSYCLLRYAINKIYKYNPHIKLLILLREPISRVFSQYNMYCKWHNKKLENDNFMRFINDINMNIQSVTKEGNWPIIRGYYDEQIEYIMKKFPKKNIYIGISEEIKLNKQIEYNKIYKFLGVTHEINITKNLDTHIGTYECKLDKKIEKLLYDIYKPHNENLYKLLGRRIEIWEKYYATLLYDLVNLHHNNHDTKNK